MVLAALWGKLRNMLAPERAGVGSFVDKFLDALDAALLVLWIGYAEPSTGGFEDFTVCFSAVDHGVYYCWDIAFGLEF